MRENALGNVRIVRSSVETFRPEGRFDALVLDPPRAGLSERSLARVREIAAGNVFYVSCNPSTLARDVRSLSDRYDLASLEMHDFFPNTHHVEALAVLWPADSAIEWVYSPPARGVDVMEIREQLYIDGRWVPCAGAGRIDVVCGSTEEVMARIPEGNAADVDAAVRSARAAFEGWAATPIAGRAAFLQKIQGGLKARSEEIGKIIAREVGMPLKLATMIQAGLPVLSFGIIAKILEDFPFEERIGNSLVVREPVGVVAAITPWNYPLHQIAAKVAPALAAGCTVVVKPSEVAPLNAFLLAEIIDAAGLPKGVFNLVTGYGAVAGEALVGHPEVDMISFTGSTRAGKRISELAARSVKRVALELGGKSASILLEDADLAAAVKGTVSSCFLNSGQTCASHTRMLVRESMYDEAAKLVVAEASKYTVGDPFSETSKLGPLAQHLRRGFARGASPQAYCIHGTPARSPGANAVTPSPIISTMPVTSWPGMIGRGVPHAAQSPSTR